MGKNATDPMLVHSLYLWTVTWRSLNFFGVLPGAINYFFKAQLMGTACKGDFRCKVDGLHTCECLKEFSSRDSQKSRMQGLEDEPWAELVVNSLREVLSSPLLKKGTHPKVNISTSPSWIKMWSLRALTPERTGFSRHILWDFWDISLEENGYINLINK